MSKNILSLAAFLWLLLTTMTTQAQETPQPFEGRVRYLLTHNWSKKLESLDYISKQRKERNAYMWGGSQSEWKTYCEMFVTPTASYYREAEEKAQDDEYNYAWRNEAYALRRNFATGMMQDQIETLGKTFVIEDSIRAQEWKIMNDLKEVAGHVCMNASWTDTLKQLNIVVWFALDIPHSGGPDRLCGLPGLILEADINDGALTLVADKIDLRSVATEMAPPKKVKGKKVKEIDYFKVLEKHVVEKRKNEEPWFWGIRYL